MIKEKKGKIFPVDFFSEFDFVIKSYNNKEDFHHENQKRISLKTEEKNHR